MMLNLRIVEVYNSLINYFSIGSFLGFWFFTLFFFSVKNDIKFIFVNFIYNNALELNIIANDLLLSYSNLFLLGDLLYNSFSYLLIFAALVLFVSMLGSIVLTIEFDYHTTKYKKIDNYTIQDIRNRIIILGISN
jgi:NADH:ubiquinone oxidoreductase subunit 6 (subunit J)